MIGTITGHYGEGNESVGAVEALSAAQAVRFGRSFYDLNADTVAHGIDVAIFLGLLPDDGTYPTAADGTAKAYRCLPDSFFNSGEPTYPNLIGRQVEGWLILMNAVTPMFGGR